MKIFVEKTNEPKSKPSAEGLSLEQSSRIICLFAIIPLKWDGTMHELPNIAICHFRPQL